MVATGLGVESVEALEAQAAGEVDRLEALLAGAAHDPAEVELAWREAEAALALIAAGRPAARCAASALGAWVGLVGAEAFEAAAPVLYGRLVRAVRAFRAENLGRD